MGTPHMSMTCGVAEVRSADGSSPAGKEVVVAGGLRFRRQCVAGTILCIEFPTTKWEYKRVALGRQVVEVYNVQKDAWRTAGESWIKIQ